MFVNPPSLLFLGGGETMLATQVPRSILDLWGGGGGLGDDTVFWR